MWRANTKEKQMAVREAVIASAVRTPIGKFQGGLASFSAPQLGAIAIREAVKRAGIDPGSVNEIYMGNVVQAAIGQAPARQAAIHGGIPPSVGATTVNKVCGSGLKAVMLAAQSIALGDADIVVAGGMESMTNAPYMLKQARTGYRLGHGELLDAAIYDGLWDSFGDYHMGTAAEIIARKFSVSREDQDRFAYESHQKAVAAQSAGKFDAEIVGVEVPQKTGEPLVITKDEPPRADTRMEVLAKLKPVFDKSGTVTAGNAPGLNDGAAALVVMGADVAKAHGIMPLARITSYAQGAMEPEMVFYAPVVAVRNLMGRMKVDIGHFDLIEANEAFAAQALVDGRELGWDWGRVNVHGGAVALGHPIGASGARVLVTLIHALKDRGKTTGMATLCLGGGEAVALAIELVAARKATKEEAREVALATR
jgi:acetyl-CoA C-acetyltransferase